MAVCLFTENISIVLQIQKIFNVSNIEICQNMFIGSCNKNDELWAASSSILNYNNLLRSPLTRSIFVLINDEFLQLKIRIYILYRYIYIGRTVVQNISFTCIYTFFFFCKLLIFLSSLISFSLSLYIYYIYYTYNICI